MKRCVGIASALACVVCSALPGGTAKSLEPLSDIIVVGGTTSVTLSWPDTVLSIMVEQSLKGAAAAGSLLQVKAAYPYARDVGLRQLQGTYRGIWFLKSDAGGWYRCLPAYGPGPLSAAFFHIASTFPSTPVFQASSGESIHDIIVRLAGTALEGPSSNPEEFLAVASGTDSPGVSGILHYFASSASSAKRAAGLAGLIARGDKQALFDFLSTRAKFSPREIDMVAARLWGFLDTDPAVIQALGSALIDPSSPASLKQATAKTLSALHTQATLPYVAALLDSPDPARQQDGVFGLSAFANGFPIVDQGNLKSMEWLTKRQDTPYTTDQTRHYLLLTTNADAAARQEIVSFWKNWWRDHAVQLGGK